MMLTVSSRALPVAADGIWGAIHERWSHVRYDIGRTTDVLATIRPIHERGRKK